jgi:hypothetical protein
LAAGDVLVVLRISKDPSLKLLFAALFLLTFPALAPAASEGPQPPCGSAAAPPYSPAGVPPEVKLWHGDDLRRAGWKPPDCSGWASSSHAQLILATAGSFRFDGTVDQLVARIGAISTLRGVRYWSVTDKRWRPLVIDAWALSRPDPLSRRPDFLAAEMTVGSELYYCEDDSRSGKIVHRMTVRERSPTRAVIAIENLTPVRLFFVTLFEPGTLQSVEFVERVSPGVWGAYLLTRTGEGASAFAGGHDASYVNRAVAIYRHLAGIPTDEEPAAVR